MWGKAGERGAFKGGGGVSMMDIMRIVTMLTLGRQKVLPFLALARVGQDLIG